VGTSYRFDSARLQNAFDRVKEAVGGGEIPAGLLAVATSREVIRCEAFSRPGGDQVKTDSIWLLASISKPIFTTALMQVVEQGKLSLNVPITRYLPEWAHPDKVPVTLWNLLNHTSGIQDAAWLEALAISEAAQQMYTMAAMRAMQDFLPGTRYRYHTLVYYLMAEMLQRATNMSYVDYLQRFVFDPLGMVDTSFDPGPAKVTRAVPVHGEMGPILDHFKSVQNPGGGLWSTAADLIRFGQAYLNGGVHGDYRLLAPATIEWITRDHVDGLTKIVQGRIEPAHYGLGWDKPTAFGNMPGSARAYGHGGATGTYLVIDPEYDLLYVLLANHWSVEWNVQYTALQAVYGALLPA